MGAYRPCDIYATFCATYRVSSAIVSYRVRRVEPTGGRRNILNRNRNIEPGILLFITFFLILTFPAIVSADENKPPPFSGVMKIEKYHLNYDVNPDGTYTSTCERVICVLTEEGVKVANHASFSYSTSLEETEILSAYTLKKDGTRVDVPASNIQEREASANSGPMFSDIKAKTIIFPEVAVGDKVEYSYKRVCKTPLYPGELSH